VTEAELEYEVLALIAPLRPRFDVLAIPDSRRLVHGKGFTDLLIVGPRAILFRELKTEDGDLSRDQQRWRYRLQAAGANWSVWRPAQLRAGRIQAELGQIG
jgi:hypothetical protein